MINGSLTCRRFKRENVWQPWLIDLNFCIHVTPSRAQIKRSLLLRIRLYPFKRLSFLLSNKISSIGAFISTSEEVCNSRNKNESSWGSSQPSPHHKKKKKLSPLWRQWRRLKFQEILSLHLSNYYLVWLAEQFKHKLVATKLLPGWLKSQKIQSRHLTLHRYHKKGNYYLVWLAE